MAIFLPTQLSLSDALRDQGLAIVDSAESDDWKARADAAMERLARSGQPFSSEDLRAEVGDPEHANAMGAVFHRAARRRLIRRYGFVTYQRPESHAHVGIAWVGVAA